MQKSYSSKSKSPYNGRPRRSSKSPITGTLHLVFSPSNLNIETATAPQSKTFSKTHSPIFFEEKKRSASREFRRTELQVIRETSTPITLDRKQVDKRVIFVAVQNLSDHSSNYKQDKQPERDSLLEVYKDALDKLPIIKHFLQIKIFKHWRTNTSKAHYYKKRAELVDKLWISRPLFSRNYTSLKEKLYNLASIQGVEIKESALYGKRQTDFSMKQQNAINQACKIIDKNTSRIMELVGNAHQDLKRIQSLESDGLIYRKITDRVTGSEEGSLTERGRRVNFREKDLREAKKMIQDRLNDAFMLYVRLVCFHSLLESIFSCYNRMHTVICGQRKPRFEVKMMLESELITTPDLETQKNEILNVISHYCKVVTSSRAMHQLNTLIQNSLNINSKFINHSKYLENVLNTREDLKRLALKVDKDLSRDVESTRRFIQSFKHLEPMLQIGEQWLAYLTSGTLEVSVFYRQNYEKLFKFIQSTEEIPTFNSISGVISLETNSLRNRFLDIPRAIIKSLRSYLTDILSHDTNLILQEITYTESTIHERPLSLAQFVEQANALSILQNAKMVEWDKRIEFLNNCLGLCKKESLEVPAGTITIISDCKNMLRSFPAKLSKAEQSFKECKAAYEEQMQKNLNKISRKIKKFELKYTARYLQDAEKLRQPLKVIRELNKRQEALLTIEKKVETYEQFDKAMKTIEDKDLRTYQLQCRKDLTILFTLHHDTIFLWQIAELWKSKSETWLGSPFAEIDLNEIVTESEDICHRLRPEHYTSVMFVRTAEKLMKLLNDEICEFMSMCDTLLDIRKADLKPRHWETIFKILRKPQFLNQAFTLQELRETNLNRFLGKIKVVIQEAYEENNHETDLLDIKHIWESLEIKTVQYRSRLDTFILSDLNDLKYLLQDQITSLRHLSSHVLSESLQYEIEEWKSKLQASIQNILLWKECQKLWLYLEPVFASVHMQDYLPREYENFLEIQISFRNLVWIIHNSPKASVHLLNSSKSEVFTDIIDRLILLKKYLKGFLDHRRASFPRFFFLSDEQLMDYLSQIDSKQIYDSHIRYIFPGAAKLYLKKIESKKKPTLDDQELDMDIAPFNMFSPAGNELLDPFEFTAEESELENSQTQFNPENSEVEKTETQSESLYEDRDDHIVAKQKRLRDKYYDAVVDISSSHPYEILGLLGYNDELLLFEKSVSLGESPEIWLMEIEKQMKETLSKMISFSVATFPKQSLDEWVLDFPQQIIFTSIMLILTHEITELMEDFAHKEDASKESDDEYDEPIPPSYQDHFSKVFFYSAAQSHSLDSSRSHLMKFLQSKSYKGLYLRLQFWINQLIKSIQHNSAISDRLTPCQLISLSSYVNLLSYQREIVKDLLDRDIYSLTDFEWQKVIRVYWNANDSICKIECGALSMMQGNEYLGNNYRMLCTPLTTRYFIFISGTVRETSAVLFKTSIAEDIAGDVFGEFANMCGVGMKRMIITPSTPLQALMMSLNGAALANVWTMFEHIERISSPNIQVLCKEIQMMQQQFIIAELGNDSEQRSQEQETSKDQEYIPTEESDKPEKPQIKEIQGTILEKSGVQTYSKLKKEESSIHSSQKSDSGFKHNIKTPQSLFVVAASLSPINLNLTDSVKLKALQCSMRTIEMLKPDSSMIFRSILIRERFRYAELLCSGLSDLYRMLFSKFEEKLVMRYRDLMVIVLLARMYKNSCDEDMDEVSLEFDSIARACRDIYGYKLLNCYARSNSLEKHESNQIIQILENCIEVTFRVNVSSSYTPLIFRNTLGEVVQALDLNYSEPQINHAEQAYKMLTSYKGFMIFGPKCSGKSTVLTLLSEGLNRLRSFKVSRYTINPSIFNNLELFGTWDLESYTSDCLFKNLIKQLNRDTSDIILLVLNSNTIDSRWSDCLISLLDYLPIIYNFSRSLVSNKDQVFSPISMINLPPGFSYSVPDQLKLVFEITDARNICPSLYTRLPTIHVNSEDLTWESLLVPLFSSITTQFLNYGLTGNELYDSFNQLIYPQILKLDQKFCTNKLWNIRMLTSSFADIFSSLLTKSIIPSFQPIDNQGLDSSQFLHYIMQEGSSLPEVLELKDRALCGMMISMVWSYGGVLNHNDRELFNAMLQKNRKNRKIKYCYPRDSNVFELVMNWKSMTFMQIGEWDMNLGNVALEKGEKFVGSIKFMQGYYAATQLCIDKGGRFSSFLIIGPPGNGKSTLARIIARNDDMDSIYTKLIYGRENSDYLRILEQSFTSKDSNTFIPSHDKSILFIIDDIHLDLQLGSNLTQLISYSQEHSGYYSYQDFTFKHIIGLHFFTCARDIPESHNLLSKSCNVLYYDIPSAQSLYQLTTTSDTCINYISLTDLQIPSKSLKSINKLDTLSKYIITNQEDYWKYTYALIHYLKEPFSNVILVNSDDFPVKDAIDIVSRVSSNRVILPDLGGWEHVDTYKHSFENALLSVSCATTGNSESKECMFVHDVSKLRNEKYLIYLNAVYSSDIHDLSLFSEQFRSKLYLDELLKNENTKRRTSVQNSIHEIVKDCIVSSREKLHLVLLLNSQSDIDLLTLRYPGLLNCSRVLPFSISQDFSAMQSTILSYINARGGFVDIDSDLLATMTSSIFFIMRDKLTHENTANYTVKLDMSKYFDIYRISTFLECLYKTHHLFSQNLYIKKHVLAERLEKIDSML